MKLATYSIGGKQSYGAVVGDGIVDLGKKIGDKYPDLRSLLAGDGLAAAKAAVAAGDLGRQGCRRDLAPDHPEP